MLRQRCGLSSLRPFTGTDGRVILPARYRVVLTEV
jgi:hypothetical protein